MMLWFLLLKNGELRPNYMELVFLAGAEVLLVDTPILIWVMSYLHYLWMG